MTEKILRWESSQKEQGTGIGKQIGNNWISDKEKGVALLHSERILHYHSMTDLVGVACASAVTLLLTCGYINQIQHGAASFNMETLIATLVGLSTLVALLWYCTATFNYWRKKGVRTLNPLPLFGDVAKIILRRQSPALVFQQLYHQFQGEKYGGIYQARTPVLLVRDPELIKQILVKDFSFFPSKGVHADLKQDPLACNLFNLEGDHYSVKLMEHLQQLTKNTDIIDVYDVLVNFTMDATGSCAFGIEVNAMTDESSIIKKMGHRVIKANGNTLNEILHSISPVLPKLFKKSVFPQEVTDFFKDIILEIINYRDMNHIVKKDVMQLLMLARNKTDAIDNNKADDDFPSCQDSSEKDEVFDEVMLAAQAAMFLRAGSEKASTTMSFCLNELAHQPELQSQLREEVESAKQEHGGQLTYEIVLGLKLMDRVVAETLRKYPLESNIYRVCKQPYTIPGSNVQLDTGTKILIPVYALHHDPENYPEPEKFDPDRFTDDNKNSRDHFTYLPFGEGPRVCIGFRYGVLQIKVGLAALLLNYEFSACSKSTPCPELSAQTWITSPANGMWLKVHKRS
ncbi:Cytochrome P450 6k1 [Blattella germanica]|nr:Cytochrome P450 6k1 [Blattella germanica]